jgi:hypothetical protein
MGTDGESMDDPVHHGTRRGKGQIVERNDVMAETFESPKAIER